MTRNRFVQAAAIATAVGTVMAASATATPQRDHPLIQEGMARAVQHAPSTTNMSLDAVNFEHVVNIDLSVFEETFNEQFGELSGDSGLGTFMDFTSFEVGDEGLRDLALLGTDFDGTFIIDITNPEEPFLRGHVPCRYEQNEVKFVNGLDRKVIAIGNQSGATCAPDSYELTVHEIADGPIGLFSGQAPAEVLSFWDITDPDNPEFLSAYNDTVSGDSHTVAAHPTEPVVIPIGGSGDRLVFVDVSDPLNPVPMTWIDAPLTIHKAHWSPDGNRLGVAGGLVEAVAVFDTTDVANPVLEASSGAPGQTYQHEVHPFMQGDRQFHIVSEENLGGPFAGYCSSTGFYVFEQVEAALIPLSFNTAGFTAGTSTQREGEDEYCTAHYGSVSHDGLAYVIPWYIAGFYLFDLSNPALPVEVGHAFFPDDGANGGSNAWTAKTYKGPYVFTGDLFRGFDVFRYTGDLDIASVATDTGEAPAPAPAPEPEPEPEPEPAPEPATEPTAAENPLPATGGGLALGLLGIAAAVALRRRR